MCGVCSAGYTMMGMTLAVASSGVGQVLESGSDIQQKQATQLVSLVETPALLERLKTPQLKDPAWLVEKRAKASNVTTNPAPRTGSRVVTYDVTTRGAITASMAEFKQQASATLNDNRGWAGLGVSFQEVASGGQFTLVLSEANQLPSFSPGCDAEWSCRAGRYVVINQDRWLGATNAWYGAGGNIRDYRHMVVNHEVGHWLGHEHEFCGGSGQPAPVMQQQSMGLQGCKPNPWPLKSELWSSQLGIQ